MLGDGKIERSTQTRITKFETDNSELGRASRDFADAMGSKIVTGITGIELVTMADAHALRKKDPKWHPDSVCNNAGGFLDERTVWGWLTSRPTRWTPDGEWRW